MIMIKKLITENLGTLRWLFTWLILVGMVIAGYHLVPIALEKLEAGRQLDIELRASGSTGLFPLGAVTLVGSLLVAFIWQFRFEKESK